MAGRSVAGSKSDPLYGFTATSSVDHRPQAMAVAGEQSVHAATDSGVYPSNDGGRTFALCYRG